MFVDFCRRKIKESKPSLIVFQRRYVGPSSEVKRLVNPTECWQGCNGWVLLGSTAEWNGLLKIVKRGKGNVSLLRFSRIGCGKGCLFCGGIQKGLFCPCGEWRGDRFYHPVVSYGLIEPYISLTATNTGSFFKKRLIFRKRNLSLIKKDLSKWTSLLYSWGRTRTCGLRVMSPTSCQLLYPASYVWYFMLKN